MLDIHYFTLSIAIHRIAETYRVELAHTDPGSQAQVAPLRGSAAIAPTALLEFEARPADYGATLARQLFSDPDVAQRFIQVETAAQAAESCLRVLICIDPSAQELQALRWELLRHPRSGIALGISETVLLSRFMVSRDWRPVRLRARAELTALIAVAAPIHPESMGLAPVDYEGEVRRIRAALAGIEVRTLGGPGSPLTPGRLMEALRGGVDILYLVSHGVFQRHTGVPALILQDDAGAAKAVLGEELAARIGELQKGPRLVVLASCQSAGDGRRLDAGSLLALDVGSPVVHAGLSRR